MSDIKVNIDFIIKEIHNAMPEVSEKKIEKLESLLRKATPDEIFRIADMFYRFDAKTVFEIIKERKEKEYEALDNASC